MDPSLGVALSAAATKRGRTLRYVPVHSLLSHAERRTLAGDWESIPRRFSAFDRRCLVSSLPRSSLSPLKAFLLALELLLLTSVSAVLEGTSPVLLGRRDPQPYAVLHYAGCHDI